MVRFIELFTWDVECVLEFWEQKKPADLDLQELGEKTVSLLALATAQRCQTLAAIRITNLVWSASKLQILIPDILKTSRAGAQHLHVTLSGIEPCCRITNTIPGGYILARATPVRDTQTTRFH